MDILDNINQIELRLQEIAQQEEANQREQANVNQRIVELEDDLKQKQQLRNQLDEEALRLHKSAEELRPKLNKLERIANLSQEFLDLHAECRDNQDLLNTLYSSVSGTPLQDAQETKLEPALIDTDADTLIVEPEAVRQRDCADYSITIEEIRAVLPNAEKLYQQLVASYLEEYKTYQNFIVDGLDLIWYAVAFLAFGRSAYRKMGFKYHPDLDGSERAMQLINTAWSISQQFAGEANQPINSVNTL